MAPWDQLSTNYRNMVHSKSEMLFESMRKCRIQIPLEILLLLDQKILKIEPEMAEQALFGGTNKRRIGHQSFHSSTSFFIF